MADNTKIEWTDATWNPITGCSVVSPGCTNCYAMRLAGTRLKHVESRKGLTRDSKAGPVWNGEVRFNEKDLDQPLRWKRPRLIFVCAHGDLFHENVPDEWIDEVFAVMAFTPQHTFQVLTKRSARMREYLDNEWRGVRVRNAMQAMHHNHPTIDLMTLPLPNVWLGVSAEDQKRADERIPDLLATPAAIRFVSAEPLLGPVDLTWIAEPDDEKEGVIDAVLGCNWIDGMGRGVAYRPTRPGHEGRVMTRHVCSSDDEILASRKLDWVIVGGESGPAARPMHPDWARSLRDQCAAAGVAFHFKQWGEWFSESREGACADLDRMMSNERVAWGDGSSNHLIHRKLGKKAAGRSLDGREHDAFPKQEFSRAADHFVGRRRRASLL
jgi:protein gp37